MKARSGAAFLLLAVASMPALAMDCGKASSKLEHRICADPQLHAADTAMSAAYFKLLRGIDDADIHASLVNSQRRWLAAREKDLGDLGGWDNDGEPLSEAQQRAIVLEATRDRAKQLSARAGSQPQFVADALKQRALVSAYSGGPFAGYQAWCSFIPGQTDHTHFGYNCFGSHAYQNGKRVCAQKQDFASYRAETTRGVAEVENGELKPVASCVLGSDGDSTCPDSGIGGSEARWNTRPSQGQVMDAFGDGTLVKLDPELPDDDGDQGWIHACLTDPAFPQADTSTGSHKAS